MLFSLNMTLCKCPHNPPATPPALTSSPKMTQAMKGEIISCAHNDIYFLETNTHSESTNMANLFASHQPREDIKCKSRTKLKHKFHPALDYFIQSPAEKATNQERKSQESSAETTSSSQCTDSRTKQETSKSRRSSIDLYEEAAAILGLTCSQTDSCRCIECQCHYFVEEDLDFQTGNDYVVDYTSSCTIQ